MRTDAQSLSVKRAEVEFHSFASMGQPERAMGVYADENQRRGALIRNHLDWIGPITPFLEIGANAGHSSYMLANEFGGDGFALDISADSLRHGIVLMEKWGLEKAPVRLAGDALHLPFADNSIRAVFAYQMLSQFMDIEAVFLEVKRVLQPGGLFIFAEEPMKRLMTLGLYRAPYWEAMKPWERKLYKWGLLGYLVRDVIGAAQEESFGIRQNHTMNLKHWDLLVKKHFADQRYQIFVPERGWAETVVKNLGQKLDPHGSMWMSARLLGGTLAAFAKKAGADIDTGYDPAHFETTLRCPDCHANVTRDAEDTICCVKCGYQAPLEGGVYNLLPSAERKELYPGDREDIIDFSLPSHDAHLIDGFYQVEGVYGNKYRWVGERCSAQLKRVRDGEQRLRIRGHASDGHFKAGTPVVEATVNGAPCANWTIERSGLFILEADVPKADAYRVDLRITPTWTVPDDERVFTVNLSMIRLVPRD